MDASYEAIADFILILCGYPRWCITRAAEGIMEVLELLHKWQVDMGFDSGLVYDLERQISMQNAVRVLCLAHRIYNQVSLLRDRPRFLFSKALDGAKNSVIFLGHLFSEVKGRRVLFPPWQMRRFAPPSRSRFVDR